MTASRRLAGSERRAAILDAAKKAFAEHGFDGTTTRELARAAGVSEALLYRHFPSKKKLYAALQDLCCAGECARAPEGEVPGGRALARRLRDMLRGISSAAQGADGEADLVRLFFRSLLEDGAFARQFLLEKARPSMAGIEEALRAAQARGEAARGPGGAKVQVWLAEHLAMALLLYRLPGRPVPDYGAKERAVEEQALWFILRGIGMKDASIRRHLAALR